MDPITQGALGAAVSVAVLGGRTKLSYRTLGWAGALSGMAADLDVLIRSSSDPLLAIEFHRHFTHSLSFVPIGGALSALPWLIAKRYRPHVRPLLATCLLGYATHGLLDAFTTYGTQLWWPFSTARVSLSWVSVVDLLYTLPLLTAVVLSVRRRKAQLSQLGLVWAAAVLLLGALQQSRAQGLQHYIALQRGHKIERSAVMPTFTNNITWRSLYSSGGQTYVDKIRVPWFSRSCITPGQARPEVPPSTDARPNHQRAHRLLRWFANDWVSTDPRDSQVLGDLRYSFEPGDATPIWGIRSNPHEDEIKWVNNRARRGLTLSHFKRLLFEDGPNAVCP